MAAPWALTHREAMAIKLLAQALVAEGDMVEARGRPSTAESRSSEGVPTLIERWLQMHPEHVIANDQKLATVAAMKAIHRELMAEAVAEINQDRAGASHR